MCQILSNDVKISEKQGNEFNLNRRKGKLTNISVFFFLKEKIRLERNCHLIVQYLYVYEGEEYNQSSYLYG